MSNNSDQGGSGTSGNGHSGPKKRKTAQQFKLISVDFKEAALDSPSFRASVNHLDTQVDNVEKWLKAIVSTITKFPRYVNELKVFSDSFLEHLLPTFLQDGLIEQEYTVQALETVTSGMAQVWDMALSSLSVDTNELELLKQVLQHNIKRYKRLRKRFELLQSKYDHYLSIYQATPKTKESEMVREDALQLFEVRKEYIHSCIDLSIELTDLGNVLDRVFVKLSCDLWNSKSLVFDKFESTARAYQDLMLKVRRIQSWCDSNTVAIEKLQTDMDAARVQVESSTQSQFQPSFSLIDYDVGKVNNATLLDIVEPAIEKHGYLFMKTWKRPSRGISSAGGASLANGADDSNGTGSMDSASGDLAIWVRRWAFIKGGVFGLLNLSPSNTFVEESDKIGLLVCNVKYTPGEDRRNCFELKTIDSTFIFQAETLLELKSWLKVFENEKNRILNEKDNTNLFNIASGRYPPILKELACTVDTVSDKNMTSSKIITKAGQVITSLKLASHIEKNEMEFQKYVYYQILQFRPPFITDSTKSAILAYSLVEATLIPTALTANIWGSINWGLYYLHASSINTSDATQEATNHQKVPFHEYPKNYPSTLVPKDIQMRSLFENAVGPGEYCLLSFRSIWSPNSKQELSGRCFVTNNHVYVYMNALGFIALFKGRIDRLVSVDYVPQALRELYELIKLYNMEGVFKMKLFLDDATVICQKMSYLINNKAKDNPDKIDQLVQKMEEIDQQRRLEIAKEQAAVPAPSNMLKEAFPLIQRTGSRQFATTGTSTSLEVISAKKATTRSYRIDFRDESKLLASSSYAIPPRAIFHVLFGDDSTIFNEVLSFSRMRNVVKKPWNTDASGKLFRKYCAQTTGDDRKTYEIQFEQHVHNMEGEEYFNVTHTKSNFKFPIGGAFKLTFRIVIYSETKGRTRVLVYGTPVFDNLLKILVAITKWFYLRVCVEEAKHILSMVRDAEKAIGSHGMVVKAIYLYGKLTRTATNIEDLRKAPVTSITFASVMVFLIHGAIVFVYGWALKIVDSIGELVIRFVKAVKMNKILIAFLFISTIFNVFLTGRSATNYWHVRRISKMADDFLTSEPSVIQKALYLKDVEDILKTNIAPKHFSESSHKGINSTVNNSETGSRCFDTFRDISFSMNHKRTNNWNYDYGDDNTREIARNLKKSIQEIAIKRNDLLIQLNMLNQIEQEIANGEWRNWLMSEIQRCDFITNEVLAGEAQLEELEFGTNSIIEYCNSCYSEVRYLDLI